ncbi:MAG: glutathione S-transferase family protein [Xanthobacteraceae bacterium]
MLKIWGRATSINVQKVMWAIGEMGLAHERIDVGGAFGRTKDPFYLAMNPNSLVPTLEEDGFILWESNTIVRYLAGKHGVGTLAPSNPQDHARASQWMDWMLTVCHPAIHGLFWGLVRTPPEKRDHKHIEESRDKTTAALKILDAQLAKTAFVAGASFTMGDIPVGLIAYRYRKLVPERQGLDNVERWFLGLEQRAAFKEHVLAIPFT